MAMAAVLRYHNKAIRTEAMQRIFAHSNCSDKDIIIDRLANTQMITVDDAAAVVKEMHASFCEKTPFKLDIEHYISGATVPDGDYFLASHAFMYDGVPRKTRNETTALRGMSGATHPMWYLFQIAANVNKAIDDVAKGIMGQSIPVITLENGAVTKLTEFRAYSRQMFWNETTENLQIAMFSDGTGQAGNVKFSLSNNTPIASLVTVRGQTVSYLAEPFNVNTPENKSIFTFTGDVSAAGDVWCNADSDWAASFDELKKERGLSDKTFVYFNKPSGTTSLNINDSKRYTIHYNTDKTLAFVTRNQTAIETSRKMKFTKNLKSGFDFVIQLLTLAAMQGERAYENKGLTAGGSLLTHYSSEPTLPRLRGYDLTSTGIDATSNILPGVMSGLASVKSGLMTTTIKKFLKECQSDLAPTTNIEDCWTNGITAGLNYESNISVSPSLDYHIYNLGKGKTPYADAGRAHAAMFVRRMSHFYTETLVRLGSKLSFSIPNFLNATGSCGGGYTVVQSFVDRNSLFDMNIPQSAWTHYNSSQIREATKSVMFSDFACMSIAASEALFAYVKVKTIDDMLNWYEEHKATFHAAFDAWRDRIDTTYDTLVAHEDGWSSKPETANMPKEIFTATIDAVKAQVDSLYDDLKTVNDELNKTSTAEEVDSQ